MVFCGFAQSGAIFVVKTEQKSMHLIQILLPLTDNDGHALPEELYEKVAFDLTHHFGGVTAYTRAPADGRWQEGALDVSSDKVVVFEVMVSSIEETWWRDYRQSLETAFRQKQVIVRAQSMRLL